MLGFFSEYEDFLFRGSILVSELLRQGYSSQIWHFCVTCWRVYSPTVPYDWFPVIFGNRDGCHMWGRKCSLFQEHTISLPLGSSMISPIHHTYIHYWICQSTDYVYGLMTPVCLPGLADCFVSDLFYLNCTVSVGELVLLQGWAGQFMGSSAACFENSGWALSRQRVILC